mgnify:CR=1 FL=1
MHGNGLISRVLACTFMWLLMSASVVADKRKDFPPPMKESEVFLPLLVSTNLHEDGAPWFSLDGRSLYWRVYDGKRFYIYHGATDVNGHFKRIKMPFSNTYRTGRICLSPDGNKLLFSSDRPVSGKGPKKDFDIWVMQKKSNQWQPPEHLSNGVNSSMDELDMSVSRNGTLYFNREGKTAEAFNILYSKPIRGKYGKAKLMDSPIASSYMEIAPYISPNETILIFTSSGRPDGRGGLDLYIAFKHQNGSWTKPINMGDRINTKYSEKFASFSPDGKYFYFVSNRPRKKPSKKQSHHLKGKQLERFQRFFNESNLKPFFCDIYYIHSDFILEMRKKALKS